MRNRSIGRYDCVLEVGCSYGFLLPSLCRISENVVGSDIERTFKQCYPLTLRQIQHNHSNLQLKIADVEKLSQYIAPESCDVIVAYSVLEHVKDYHRAIKEIYRCLKLNGIFLCGLPSENLFYEVCREIAGYKSTHNSYNYESVRREATALCFEEDRLNVPYGFPLFKINIYRKLA